MALRSIEDHPRRSQSTAWQDVAVAALADIVIDCHHPSSLARFWAAVLDEYEVAPYDQDEIARLAALGVDDVEDDPTVLVAAPAGPRLWFQAVPESKVVKNRVHLDVRVGVGLVGEERLATLEAECARLVTLGAVRVQLLRADGYNESCIVMQDIEGNEFCLD